jgi:large subunit ribosomal protein L28
MAICTLTGKSWMNGNKVSHSNIKTHRRVSANIQKKRIFDVETGRWVRVRLSTRALRTLNLKSLSQMVRENLKSC